MTKASSILWSIDKGIYDNNIETKKTKQVLYRLEIKLIYVYQVKFFILLF